MRGFIVEVGGSVGWMVTFVLFSFYRFGEEQ